MVLPYINMNPPQVYTCSPSWTLLLPPSPYHPSGSSQCTSPKHPVSCVEPGLATCFIYDIIHVSMPVFFLILFLKFTILYWFCQISKWIRHRYTCVPHPEPTSLLPPQCQYSYLENSMDRRTWWATQSMRLQRVGYSWATGLACTAFTEVLSGVNLFLPQTYVGGIIILTLLYSSLCQGSQDTEKLVTCGRPHSW